MTSIARLRGLLERVEDLRAAAAVLEWDQETYMPEGAAEARALQVSTLRRLAHELFTDDEIGHLLDAAGTDGLDPDSVEARLVRVARRDFDKAVRVPAALVAEMAEAVARAKTAWRQARADDDFGAFAPHLERLVALNIRKAEALGYDDRLYDALLDQYEPGMNTAEVEAVFEELREGLVPLAEAILAQEGPDDGFLHQPFDRQQQWDFGVAVLRDIGYDFQRGRQDLSAHPFTTTFSVSDVRLTTRIRDDFFPAAFFGTLHEAGHGLYEQGVDPTLDRTPLADGTSLGIHESQSRLWENLVGRSRPFWRHYYPKLRAAFPTQLADVPLEVFYRGINRVARSLIRVEADEVTYNLHIMLRFEIEQALVEGRVEVAELPELWNAKMEAYLGRRPPTNALGVLQDIHWALGTLGYFPTYTLGNLASVQLFDQARRDLPDLDGWLASGEFAPLLGWLREHIHRWGRRLDAAEILERTTGTGLRAAPWLAYVRRKYGELYEGIA